MRKKNFEAPTGPCPRTPVSRYKSANQKAVAIVGIFACPGGSPRPGEPYILSKVAGGFRGPSMGRGAVLPLARAEAPAVQCG